MNSIQIDMVKVDTIEDLGKILRMFEQYQTFDQSNYSGRFQCKIISNLNSLNLYINHKKYSITLSNKSITLKELTDIDHDTLCILACFSKQNIILDEVVKTLICGVAAQKGVGEGSIINFKQVNVDDEVHFDFEFIKITAQNQITQSNTYIMIGKIEIHTGTGDNIQGDKKVYNINKIDKADFS